MIVAALAGEVAWGCVSPKGLFVLFSFLALMLLDPMVEWLLTRTIL